MSYKEKRVTVNKEDTTCCICGKNIKKGKECFVDPSVKPIQISCIKCYMLWKKKN